MRIKRTFFVAKKDNTFGLFVNSNEDLEQLLPFEYDDIKIISDNIAILKKKDNDTLSYNKQHCYYYFNTGHFYLSCFDSLAEFKTKDTTKTLIVAKKVHIIELIGAINVLLIAAKELRSWLHCTPACSNTLQMKKIKADYIVPAPQCFVNNNFRGTY